MDQAITLMLSVKSLNVWKTSNFFLSPTWNEHTISHERDGMRSPGSVSTVLHGSEYDFINNVVKRKNEGVKGIAPDWLLHGCAPNALVAAPAFNKSNQG